MDENELHKRTQDLRNLFAEHIKELKEQNDNWGKYNKINTQINNRLVEILILNELLHRTKDKKTVNVIA